MKKIVAFLMPAVVLVLVGCWKDPGTLPTKSIAVGNELTNIRGTSSVVYRYRDKDCGEVLRDAVVVVDDNGIIIASVIIETSSLSGNPNEIMEKIKNSISIGENYEDRDLSKYICNGWYFMDRVLVLE